ncbi:MAG TPA: ABC transporter permease [Gaiellaceae bacterium]|nr:ABC transporter permease [Gaiellaceae bacterium]
MLAFTLKRVLWTIPVLLVCVTLLFGLMRAIQSSPLRHAPPLGLSNVAWVKYGDWQPEAIRRNQERRLGIDKPWYVQYIRYLRSLARFDFGPTFTFPNRTVNSILREQGPITLELALLALGLAFALGIPLGVLAALWSGTLVDRVVTALVAVTMGVPAFFAAAVLLWRLAVKAGAVPAFGWDGWRAKLLPTFVLALGPLSMITRVLRAEMLAVLGNDYVRSARAKGLRRGRVLRVHVLRPALIPIVSMTGPLLGSLVMGLFVVEYMFAIPGIGRYFIAAAGVGDYPLTLGLTVVLTTAIVITNLLSDIALAALDPRIRDG